MRISCGAEDTRSIAGFAGVDKLGKSAWQRMAAEIYFGRNVESTDSQIPSLGCYTCSSKCVRVSPPILGEGESRFREHGEVIEILEDDADRRLR